MPPKRHHRRHHKHRRGYGGGDGHGHGGNKGGNRHRHQKQHQPSSSHGRGGHHGGGGGAELRVVTWNVERLRGSDHRRVHAITQHLRRLRPDLLSLIELVDRAAAAAILRGLNSGRDAASDGAPFGMVFHDSHQRNQSHALNLALLYRKAALLGPPGGGGPLVSHTRFDDDASLAVTMVDPESVAALHGAKTRAAAHASASRKRRGGGRQPLGCPSNALPAHRTFELRLRRGYLCRCHPRATKGRALNVVGLHLKSLRGNAFSHYKRMAQARIVRAALQRRGRLDEDLVVLGDLNSSETDPRINPLPTTLTPAARAAARRFASVCPTEQRTFVVQTLRHVDVRLPEATLANVHTDGAPTWRRAMSPRHVSPRHGLGSGSSSSLLSQSSDGGGGGGGGAEEQEEEEEEVRTSQLDHILFRFGGAGDVADGVAPRHRAGCAGKRLATECRREIAHAGSGGGSSATSDHAALVAAFRFRFVRQRR